MNKVYDGTPNHSGAALCESCRSAIVVRGQRLADSKTFCRSLAHNGSAYEMTFHVHQCSAFDDARQPSRYDLEAIAWVVTTSPSRKVGFMSPQERQRDGYPAAPPISR